MKHLNRMRTALGCLMVGLLALSGNAFAHVGVVDPAAGGIDNFTQFNIHNASNFQLTTATGTPHENQSGVSLPFPYQGRIGGNSWNTGALANNLSTAPNANFSPTNPNIPNANGAIASVFNFSPLPMQGLINNSNGKFQIDFTISAQNNSGLVPALALFAGVDNTTGGANGLTQFATSKQAMSQISTLGAGGDAGVNAPKILSGNQFVVAQNGANTLTASWIVDLGSNQPNGAPGGITNYTNNFDYLTLIMADASGNTSAKDFTATITVNPAPVPLPGAVWLMGSALAGLLGVGRRRKSHVVMEAV